MVVAVADLTMTVTEVVAAIAIVVVAIAIAVVVVAIAVSTVALGTVSGSTVANSTVALVSDTVALGSNAVAGGTKAVALVFSTEGGSASDLAECFTEVDGLDLFSRVFLEVIGLLVLVHKGAILAIGTTGGSVDSDESCNSE